MKQENQNKLNDSFGNPTPENPKTSQKEDPQKFEKLVEENV